MNPPRITVCVAIVDLRKVILPVFGMSLRVLHKANSNLQKHISSFDYVPRQNQPSTQFISVRSLLFWTLRKVFSKFYFVLQEYILVPRIDWGFPAKKHMALW